MNKTDDRVGVSAYRPISCDIYSRLELAILHRERLHLIWRQDNVRFTLPVMPTDLETRAGEEFLHCRLPGGDCKRIRLDYIDRMESA
jgi:Rho-binding antiterminator